jgi:hypothetical protein
LTLQMHESSSLMQLTLCTVLLKARSWAWFFRQNRSWKHATKYTVKGRE